VSTDRQPQSPLEAVSYFSDLDVATDFVAKLRWPSGPVCPKCGSAEKHSYISTRRVWKCKTCKRQFSVKVGTIFEDSALGLDKWLPAIWLAANSKNGISSHELGRAIGTTQKSAWFMLHRIRLAMQTGSFEMLAGDVEVDETYVGGKAINMHAGDRKRKLGGKRGGTVGKTPVLGMIERGGRVRAEVVPNIRRQTLQGRVKANVERGSTVYTDAFSSYVGLDWPYDHKVIDHMVSYVDGKVHTNRIENFWSLVKRGLNGTYVSVEPRHLFRYLDERVFTFNERETGDFGRFELVLRGAIGRRVTYATLTQKA
jgi:transposase-like protein